MRVRGRSNKSNYRYKPIMNERGIRRLLRWRWENKVLGPGDMIGFRVAGQPVIIHSKEWWEEDTRLNKELLKYDRHLKRVHEANKKRR